MQMNGERLALTEIVIGSRTDTVDLTSLQNLEKKRDRVDTGILFVVAG